MSYIRKAINSDLEAIVSVEKAAFSPFQQSTKRTLKLSLNSLSQEVWVYDDPSQGVIGVLILHLHKKTLRIYSVGVSPTCQSSGIGSMLMNHACSLALTYGNSKVSLEASVSNAKLIKWYESKGFVFTELMEDYYTEGEHAQRMVFAIPEAKDRGAIENVVVVDKVSEFKFESDYVTVVAAKDYIKDQHRVSQKNVRVFNLCNSYAYQSFGYYVSLLASARDQRVMPNVSTIRDFNSTQIIRSVMFDLDDVIQESLSKSKENSVSLLIYFGQSSKTGFKKLAQQLFQVFEAPVLLVKFTKGEKWVVQKVSPMRINKLEAAERELLYKFAAEYFQRRRFRKSVSRQYKYDLAILVNPTEEHPPSDPQALLKFKKAAEKIGFCTEFITKDDIDRISEFDALFIRETTNVKDHTYLMSRLAYAEGLVVIDDPWSILRCSNKIFQNEIMKQHNVLTPATQLLVKGNFTDKDAEEMKLPVVLKQPDSAFSIGVVKADTKEDLIEKVNHLFKTSDLIVAQEFLYSEYDWRIGVLDQSPLFACKYYMSKGHWQIYNWDSSEGESIGDDDVLDIKDVPPKVVQTALKACSLIGDGLYGVDLKMVDDKVYVIEVNDNPNVDVDVEDRLLGDEIYDRIMMSIMNRIEVSRNIRAVPNL